MSPAGPSRKQARRDAVFLLYQTEVTSLPMADLVKGQKLREGYGPDEFTVKAVAGVLRDRAALDAELEAHSKGWTLDRVAPLELSILRLALWEIRSEVSPPEVAIDEAVRLTKRYSTDEAGAFVNGVLGGCLRGADDDGPAEDGITKADPDAEQEPDGETEPDAEQEPDAEDASDAEEMQDG